MLGECFEENCTVGTTGQCLLNHEPAASCPHYKVLIEALDKPAGEEELLSEPEQNPSFGSSNTLTEDRLNQIMGSRYCTMVGIIGPPDAGKTAALVSIYLLLSHGRLHGFEYADSRTLMAFDEISRGARRWTGGTPQQMTAHTELSDDRAAGFLHLRIRASNDGVPIDLLLPDLPGEWSTAMVEESRQDRLAFLERADVVWLMVDGGRLTNVTQRQGAIHRTKLYLQRLKQFFPDLPRVILVVTRADTGAVNEKTLENILNEGVALGIDVTVQAISSFSTNPDVPAGTGIAELIRASKGKQPGAPEFWPPSKSNGIGRAIENAARGDIEI
ncbi:hypothetical protein E0H62_14875 [Rhizobium leguminosarum bv. viciae]|nr:hypothetical protein E0H62_14875 [Rhizobium leguminosarum bv. viciae]